MTYFLTPIELVQHVCRDVTDVPVVSKVPVGDTPLDLFVRVDQAAPRVLSPVHQRARVMIQVYGRDIEKVIDLAFAIRERLADVSAYHPAAYGAEEINGPQENPDPDDPELFRWEVTGLLYMATRA